MRNNFEEQLKFDMIRYAVENFGIGNNFLFDGREEQKKAEANNFVEKIAANIEINSMQDYGVQITLSDKEKEILADVMCKAGEKIALEIKRCPEAKKELETIAKTLKGGEEKLGKMDPEKQKGEINLLQGQMVGTLLDLFEKDSAVKKSYQDSSIYKKIERMNKKGLDKVIHSVGNFAQSVVERLVKILDKKAKASTTPKEQTALQEIKNGVRKLVPEMMKERSLK